MIAGYRAAHTFYNSNAWSDVITGLLAPWTDTNIMDDAFVEAQVREGASSTHHPTSTASMSPANAQWGVVNPDLRVKNVHGLRVVDASVIVSSFVVLRSSEYSLIIPLCLAALHRRRPHPSPSVCHRGESSRSYQTRTYHLRMMTPHHVLVSLPSSYNFETN